jgi:hypothetical protein
LSEEGRVLGLEAEAGFFEIEGGDYVVDSMPAQVGHQRLWYSFHPAEQEPENKPIFVFFNGGPGSATAPLFAYNTAPFTLDPSQTGSAALAPCEEPWSSVANLLYIDAPNTGFSYTLALDGGIEPSVRIDPDRDAAAFVKLLLRFLAAHPDLHDEPVVLVAESFGGVRAQLMLGQVLNYETLTDGPYEDPGLREELIAHFAAVFPDTDGTGLAPERIAEQFGHQVLIQAVVTGITQLNLPVPGVPEGCMSNSDLYQCDEANGYTFDRIYEAAARLMTLEVFEQVIGVDPSTIVWLLPEARSGAYGRGEVGAQEALWVDPGEFVAAFGELGPEDRYFLGYNAQVNALHPQGLWSMDPATGERFLSNVRYVRTMITDAGRDRSIWGPNIPLALAEYSETLVSAIHDVEARPGVERPGWIQLTYQPAATLPGQEAELEIRFPHYAISGHMVTHRQAGELLADLADFLAD